MSKPQIGVRSGVGARLDPVTGFVAPEPPRVVHPIHQKLVDYPEYIEYPKMVDQKVMDDETGKEKIVRVTVYNREDEIEITGKSNELIEKEETAKRDPYATGKALIDENEILKKRIAELEAKIAPAASSEDKPRGPGRPPAKPVAEVAIDPFDDL